MEDLNEAGGVYAVMNELTKKNLLNLDCMTVTGKTVGENIKGCVNKNPEVIRTDRQSVQPDRRYRDPERKPGTGYRRCKTFRSCTGDAGT